MRSRRFATIAVSALVLALAGCSAASDFDYSFHASEGKDAGREGGAGLDGQVGDDKDTGPIDDRDSALVDGGTPTPDAQSDAQQVVDAGSCVPPSCCELSETTERTCMGGRDEDCDGEVDCADPDCRQSPTCCPSPTVESGPKACKDGIDNDCDGTVDCAETACSTLYVCTCGPSTPEDATLPASCLDRKDNDCDHLIDCEETACAFSEACCTKTPLNATTETGAQCTDGLNNDCDPAGADCADPDCRMSSDAGSVGVESGATCVNRLDDDCDGQKDCADPDCRDALECCTRTPGQEQLETACADGVNNDCDAQGFDCADPDCALDAACCRPVVGGESTLKLCGNNRDDDCDGQIDCADTQCSGSYDCCVAYLKQNRLEVQTSEAGLCADSFDNDCDGALNCRDSDCGGIKTCGGIIIIDPPVQTL